MDEASDGKPDSGVRATMTVPAAIVAAGLIIGAAILLTKADSGRNQAAVNLSEAIQSPTAPAAENKAVDIKPIGPEDHILGNPQAPVMVVEYSDLECPWCKRFHTTLHRLIDEYGRKGDVAWVYRHFPLYKGTADYPPLHSKAGKEAEATECAAELGGNDGFWRMTDKIFAVTPSNNGLDLASLSSLAAEVGLNRTQFEKCLASAKYAAKIEADYNAAVKAGGQATPYTVIVTASEKFPITQGAIPYETLQRIIEERLKKN